MLANFLNSPPIRNDHNAGKLGNHPLKHTQLVLVIELDVQLMGQVKLGEKILDCKWYEELGGGDVEGSGQLQDVQVDNLWR